MNLFHAITPVSPDCFNYAPPSPFILILPHVGLNFLLKSSPGDGSPRLLKKYPQTCHSERKRRIFLAEGTILRTFEKDPSSPTDPQDDIYDTFSVVSNRPLGGHIRYPRKTVFPGVSFRYILGCSLKPEPVI